MKASPEMSELQLFFDFRLQTAILDACFDAIFKLDQITILSLVWNRMSLEKIKSTLRKQEVKKKWEFVDLGDLDKEINDADILEICSYLPSLIEWTVSSPRSTLTIDGAREWKRICPNLETVLFFGGELPEEVKEMLRGLGVTAK
jgi:hypothetical protein